MKYICRQCGVTWVVPNGNRVDTGSTMTLCPECANRPANPNQEKLETWTAWLLDIIIECEKDPALAEYLRPELTKIANILERSDDGKEAMARNPGRV